MICGTTEEDGGICDCLKRTTVPEYPAQLPFPCSPENKGRMKTWLFECYKGSTFNKCPYQSLPTMTGSPVEIHLKDVAKPVAYHKESSIPLHWQERVHMDLKRDEALGVIERVPFGEPAEWCHRMVMTRKEDGSPRRTVNLSPLNRHCKRETHSSESPIHLARRIPQNTWKTVTDAGMVSTVSPSESQTVISQLLSLPSDVGGINVFLSDFCLLVMDITAGSMLF